MTARTHAETLRAAAVRLREVAGEATPGPWQVGRAWPADVCTEEEMVFGSGFGPDVDLFDVEQRNARWIALMHPGIAEPLALLLTAIAEQADQDTDLGVSARRQRHDYEHPLSIARVILREADDEEPRSAALSGTESDERPSTSVPVPEARRSAHSDGEADS